MTWLYIIMTAIALPTGGVMMQKLWKNQLGDVYSVGLGSAACLGGAFASATGICSIFVGAFVSCIICAVAGALVYRFVTTENFIVFGMLFGSAIGSLCTIVANNASADALQTYYRWAGASFHIGSITALENAVALLAFVLGVAGAVMSAKWIDAETPTKGQTLVTFLSQSLLVSSVISVCGIIGMISLTCPNLARLLTKRHSYSNLCIFASAIALVLLIATNLVAEYVNFGIYLPISATMSIISLPLMFLVFKK